MPVKQRRGRKYMKKRPVRGYKRGMNKISRAIHSFKRTVNLGTALTQISNVGTTTNYSNGFNFRLNQIPNYTEYQSLYDQYKMTGVSFKIMPKWTNPGNGSNSNTVAGVGQIITVIDYDDSLSPLTRDELLEFQTAKVSSCNRQHVRYIKPKILGMVYRTATTQGLSVIPSKYLDMGLADLPHFGLKVWIDGPNPNSQIAAGGPFSPLDILYDLYATYYFKCKNTR